MNFSQNTNSVLHPVGIGTENALNSKKFIFESLKQCQYFWTLRRILTPLNVDHSIFINLQPLFSINNSYI